MMNIEALHKELPVRIPAEVSDRIQFCLRSYADQQMRFVIFLSKRIDFDILKKAFRLVIYNHPVFSFYYKEDSKLSWWQKQETVDTSLLLDLVETNDEEETEISRFLTLEITPFGFPVVRARVIRNDNRDIICINMNHTPTDGAGLKEFVKKLAEIYTRLITSAEVEIKPEINGDRSLKQVTAGFSLIQKLKFMREGFKTPEKGLTWSFDWAKTEKDNQKFFTFLKIVPAEFAKIKAYSKLNNATINDIVLTAFIRAFESAGQSNQIAAKPVIVPVDLRKYKKADSDSPICSLTGSLICNIGRSSGNSFKETLDLVRNEMNKKKAAHSEMNRIMQISVLSAFIPYNTLKEKLMNVKMPPIPLVTNVGIINEADIAFDNIQVEDAYMTGAISLQNYFSMAYCTFKNAVTFSVGYSGGEAQVTKVKAFLINLKSELESIIEE
jgi:NRPS condensation-like uncharacterized protein